MIFILKPANIFKSTVKIFVLVLILLLCFHSVDIQVRVMGFLIDGLY